MAVELPDLPYAKNALEPHISQETLEYHYGKHHKAYVDNLNKMLAASELENEPLETIIRQAKGGMFNNAAQVWNHSFYWNCLSPEGGGEPSGELGDAIKRDFDSFANFRDKFTESAKGNFASGWTWLVKGQDGKLKIVNTDDAKTPVTTEDTPLMTIDVWEHAYYIDYRNARPQYVDAYWHLINWDFVAKNLADS